MISGKGHLNWRAKGLGQRTFRHVSAKGIRADWDNEPVPVSHAKTIK
jgi:hypothetical protein